MGDDRPPAEGPEQTPGPTSPEPPQAFPGSAPSEPPGRFQIRQGPALSEMSVGEILDSALKLYRSNWKTFLAIVAIVMVPYIFIQSILVSSLAPVFGAILTLVLAFIITPFVTGAVAKATADIYLGSSPEVGETYSFALGKLGSLLIVSILYGLVVVGGLILLIIPGIYFAVKYIFSTTAVIVENRSGIDALKRSGALSKEFFWKIFGTLILTAIIVLIVGALLGFLLQFVLSPLPDWLGMGMSESIATVITTPFQTMVIVLLYFDLRIRKEAFDLSVMAQELGQNPPE